MSEHKVFGWGKIVLELNFENVHADLRQRTGHTDFFKIKPKSGSVTSLKPELKFFWPQGGYRGGSTHNIECCHLLKLSKKVAYKRDIRQHYHLFGVMLLVSPSVRAGRREWV